MDFRGYVKTFRIASIAFQARDRLRFFRVDRNRAGASRVRATSMLRSLGRRTQGAHIRRYFQRAPINHGTYLHERAAARNGLNRQRKEIGGDEGCARNPAIRANR